MEGTYCFLSYQQIPINHGNLNCSQHQYNKARPSTIFRRQWVNFLSKMGNKKRILSKYMRCNTPEYLQFSSRVNRSEI